MITGRKIGQVSHCVLAAERLIYPLFWQSFISLGTQPKPFAIHLRQYPFIPVLTKYEFLHCPTPFLAGVPKPTFEVGLW